MWFATQTDTLVTAARLDGASTACEFTTPEVRSIASLVASHDENVHYWQTYIIGKGIVKEMDTAIWINLGMTLCTIYPQELNRLLND